VVGHEKPLGEEGDEAVEPAFEDFSYSASLQASEQYTFPSVCRSQARQKSGDQSMSKDMVCRGRMLEIPKGEGGAVGRAKAGDEEFFLSSRGRSLLMLVARGLLVRRGTV
jgi:hypothetical protein